MGRESRSGRGGGECGAEKEEVEVEEEDEEVTVEIKQDDEGALVAGGREEVEG